jgi:molecular chaperone GrpE
MDSKEKEEKVSEETDSKEKNSRFGFGKKREPKAQHTPDKEKEETPEEEKTEADKQPTAEKEEKKEEKEEKKATLTPEQQLEKQLAEVKSELDDYKDKYLRLAAEFDNFRRRTNKEKADLILNGSAKSINSFLPVLDDLERALANMEKTDDLKAVTEGINLIYTKFVQILNQNGVKEIETIGKELDTDYHEAIALIPVEDEEKKGKIIDCTQKGYTLNDKVIRHAKVVIGK